MRSSCAPAHSWHQWFGFVTIYTFFKSVWFLFICAHNMCLQATFNVFQNSFFWSGSWDERRVGNRQRNCACVQASKTHNHFCEGSCWDGLRLIGASMWRMEIVPFCYRLDLNIHHLIISLRTYEYCIWVLSLHSGFSYLKMGHLDFYLSYETACLWDKKNQMVLFSFLFSICFMATLWQRILVLLTKHLLSPLTNPQLHLLAKCVLPLKYLNIYKAAAKPGTSSAVREKAVIQWWRKIDFLIDPK